MNIFDLDRRVDWSVGFWSNVRFDALVICPYSLQSMIRIAGEEVRLNFIGSVQWTRRGGTDGACNRRWVGWLVCVGDDLGVVYGERFIGKLVNGGDIIMEEGVETFWENGAARGVQQCVESRSV